MAFLTTRKLPSGILPLMVVLLSALCVEAAIHQAPCVKKWSGPSATNDYRDCTNAKELETWIITKIAMIIFPFIFGIMFLLVCPYVYCARYCCKCCGGYKQRPGSCCCGDPKYDEMPDDEVWINYSRGDVSCAKFATLGLVVLAIIFVSLTFAGSVRLVKGIDNIGVGIRNVIALVHSVVDQFIAGTERDDGTFFVHKANFSKVLDSVDGVYTSYEEEKYQKWVRLAKEVGNSLGYCAVLPAICIAISVLLAFLHVRTCVPCLLTLLFFLFAFVYGLAGTVFLTVHLPLDLVCGEVNAQLEREPSILQWYVVPTCEKDNLLAGLTKEVDKLEASASEAACKGIKEICNDASQPATTTHQFSCDLTLGANCTTFDHVDEFAKSMSLKPASVESCGTNPGGRATCDLCACGTYCTDTTVKDSAFTACRAIGDAKNVLSSFKSAILPWLNCNRLLDAIVSVIKPACDELPAGFYLLGVGCTFVVFSMLPALIIVFRGQKRWFVRPDHIAFRNQDPMGAPLAGSHTGGTGYDHNNPEGGQMMGPPPPGGYQPVPPVPQKEQRHVQGKQAGGAEPDLDFL